MSELFSHIFSTLTVPPGSIIYHLVLIFSIASALQSAFNHWRSSDFPQARRTMVGLGLLLSAQVILFIFSGLGWQGIFNSTASLPPTDRAFTLFSIIWITWLWGFPEPSNTADLAAILWSLLVGIAMWVGLQTWSGQAALTTYNATLDDTLWQVASILLVVIGALLLLVRRPNGYGKGLFVLGMAFAGHAGHLLLREEGNFSGIVRVAYMAAFPILMTLPQRFPAPAAFSRPAPAKPEASSGEKGEQRGERRRYSTDPKTFHALLALAAESNPAKVSHAITRAIAQTMLADLCFLIYLTDNKNQVQIVSGYDLIREENLEGGSMNKSLVPMLTNAMQRGRPLRLPASSTSADIKGLGDLLGLSDPGHLMSVPIVTPDKDSIGGVILLSPYSNRLWSAEDQAFLINIATSLVPIIQRGQKITRLEEADQQTKQALEVARSHITALERRNDELGKQVEAMNLQAEREAERGENVAALMAVQEESQRTIEQLQKELELVRASRNKAGSAEAAQIQKELKASQEEAARLQSQLAEVNTRLAELDQAGEGQAPHRPSEQAEVIASISQELRQPMSSIVGYTDLLLGESVGILGALQRKFVERIKASTERLGSLIDDMIHLTTLETGLVGLHPESVDLNSVIDNAMAYTSSQVREKNISMHLDLPKKLAALKADREALQQILIHLLQNAGAATPVEGKITLRVQTQSEKGQDYVMIQVTDSGGGIPADDLPRVFTRLYRADNVLIEGVGDTGVGLSIAKTLTEAQRGRIWVESKPGAGATFSVLLPVERQANGDLSEAAKGKK